MNITIDRLSATNYMSMSKALEIVGKLNADGEDNWEYVAEYANASGDSSIIRVYDEARNVVGFL